MVLESYEELTFTGLTWDKDTVILTFEPFELKASEMSYLVSVSYSGGDYVYADPFIVTAANPIIMSISDVDDIEVTYGTSKEEAIDEVAVTTTITDSAEEEHSVELAWQIKGYDGNASGDYTATGTFDLPESVDQSDPPLDLEVTATVTFKEDYEDNGYIPGDPGEQTSHSTNGIHFNIRLAPVSTFPTGTDDDGKATVDYDFWVAETQVTYELWYEGRQWALDNGYTFANVGREGSQGAAGEEPSGSKNEPVTWVSWYNSIVWCNALSE